MRKSFNRTFNTLFLLSSVDGKISTGASDARDFDKDLKNFVGIKEGLNQYYALEQQTDLYSLNTGRVMEKIGVNKKQKSIVKLPVSFIVIDNKPHLTTLGVENLLRKCKYLFIVTTNPKHPAFSIKSSHLQILFHKHKIDFSHLFEDLHKVYKINKVTIQSGGTLNAELLRAGLIDGVSLVVAPALIGGRHTPTAIDGEDILSVQDLTKIRPLRLASIKKLKDSYLHLVYDVVNS